MTSSGLEAQREHDTGGRLSPAVVYDLLLAQGRETEAVSRSGVCLADPEVMLITIRHHSKAVKNDLVEVVAEMLGYDVEVSQPVLAFEEVRVRVQPSGTTGMCAGGPGPCVLKVAIGIARQSAHERVHSLLLDYSRRKLSWADSQLSVLRAQGAEETDAIYGKFNAEDAGWILERAALSGLVLVQAGRQTVTSGAASQPEIDLHQ